MATAVLDDAEQALIARCRRGDPEAFRLLMDRHHQRVYRTAYAVTGGAAEAGEIVQETFIKAWRGLPRFRNDAALATWLTRVALNTARARWRRRWSRAVLDAARGLIHLQPARDASAAIEDRDELQQALRRFSPRAAGDRATLRPRIAPERDRRLARLPRAACLIGAGLKVSNPP